MSEGVWTGNGKHTANYNVLAVCQGNVTLRIVVDRPHRAVVPCRVKRQLHTETAILSECFENYISWKAVQQEQAQAQRQAKRVLANKYKQASTASKSRQGKAMVHMGQCSKQFTEKCTGKPSYRERESCSDKNFVANVQKNQVLAGNNCFACTLKLKGVLSFSLKRPGCTINIRERQRKWQCNL